MRITLIIFLAGVLTGCTTTAPHQNFKNIREQNIGQRYDAKYSDINWYPNLIEDKYLLGNGNTEYKFRGRGTCRYFYEVDKGSGIIIKWRFEGSKDDCIVIP